VTARPAASRVWTGEPLVVCTDGPNINQWYTATDWRERVAAARRMAARDQPRSPVLDYVEGTGKPVVNRELPGATGTPLVYRPHPSAERPLP
jgi:hypothetical protein